jgi:uncharacterized protein involved in exopolysaccharide biosynthesis
MFVFAVASASYALLATEWYRAEVLLAPAEQQSGATLGGNLGGLAALAGVSLGGGDSLHAIATLESRELAKEFINKNQLLPILLPGRSSVSNGPWRGEGSENEPDERDALRYFHQNVLHVSEGRKSGLVTVAIEWKDPEVAAAWAMELVELLNEKLRDRASSQAEDNISYLQTELSSTNIVTLQQAIGRLLEAELQKLMLARGDEEFAFRVIDAAQPPKYRVRPKRTMIVVFGALAGAFIGILWVLSANALRSD